MFWRAAGAPKFFLFGCLNLSVYLDYPETDVLSCPFALRNMFFFRNSSLYRRHYLDKLGIYRIHSRLNIWTGKVIINWNHYKINAGYNSYNVCKWKDYQNIFILSIFTIKHKTKAVLEIYDDKTAVTLPWPPKILHRGGWGIGINFFFWVFGVYEF